MFTVPGSPKSTPRKPRREPESPFSDEEQVAKPKATDEGDNLDTDIRPERIAYEASAEAENEGLRAARREIPRDELTPGLHEDRLAAQERVDGAVPEGNTEGPHRIKHRHDIDPAAFLRESSSPGFRPRILCL